MNYKLLTTFICRLSSALYICREPSTNQLLFMQNKPNLPDAQMNVNIYHIKDYQIFIPLAGYKNKPNSNPIKPNLRKAKMDVSLYVIEDYRKKDDFTVRINKPNFRNGQNERKLNFNKGLQKKRLFSTPKNKPNSKPIKACFFLDLSVKEPIVIFYKAVTNRESPEKIII